MEPVFGKLNNLNIEPLGPVVDEAGPSPGIERLRRRAEVLRRQWASEVENAEVKTRQQDAGAAWGGDPGYVGDLWADRNSATGALTGEKDR